MLKMNALEKAIRWAWMQADDNPLPPDMADKLSKLGVVIKAKTAGELIDELDPTGLLAPGRPKSVPDNSGAWWPD